MDLEAFNYNLPKKLIAQYPLERGTEKLIVVDRAREKIYHRSFGDLVDYIRSEDCMVLNDSKVIPARLLGWKATGGKVEVLLVKRATKDRWWCLFKASKIPKEGAHIYFSNELSGIIEKRQKDLFLVSFSRPEMIFSVGLLPLPPYINRPPEKMDNKSYQTVYARHDGSVAAPTAGLHFSLSFLNILKDKGVELVWITLHIGPGTFRPVRVQRIEDHSMEREDFFVSKDAANAINNAIKQQRRIIAVGTTTTRVIEHLLKENGEIVEGPGSTGLFIYPGFKFKGVGGLLTNLHLPCSTLLMLTSAFGGQRVIMEAYREAVIRKYRFFSYGDVMFIF
ncbi:MAG: tRNA preQ1(34) S-adenosylmethionine ribosyltransferase-isomerase QueA [Deltaproteobacteria bacterium]|nr:tRNA preQ1(34) S-adenosylmethionine ribosyltransferase-isomerase QueA [Deltaproteobacteria bacterium]